MKSVHEPVVVWLAGMVQELPATWLAGMDQAEIYINMHCIGQICKQYAVKICRNMQFYMQHMQKSIYCIFLHLYALPTLLMKG